MVSKMVIEFFLGLTTMKLGEFVYRLAFNTIYVAVAGLRVKCKMFHREKGSHIACIFVFRQKSFTVLHLTV